MAGAERDADVLGLAVPPVGALQETGDLWEPFQLVDAAGAVVGLVAADAAASGTSR
jgi:hypothetical protein